MKEEKKEKSIIEQSFGAFAEVLVHKAQSNKGLDWFRKKVAEAPEDFQEYMKRHFAF